MTGGLPAAAYAVALSLLPGAGPVSLATLLADGDPVRAWDDVLAGRAVRPRGRSSSPGSRRVEWEEAAERTDVAAAWERTRQAGIEVTWVGRPGFPTRLVDDPAPPPVLFSIGSLEALSRPCVALVGTRQATHDGRALAFEMGRDLAAAGVCVVSGLALGIDGAAHRGALAAGRPGATVGVAASGCDRPYPTRHRALWSEVAACGAVVSETPPGRPAQTWRFPARNRIIAALASVVVVGESHAAGGSLLTAEAAIERGIEVRAVPGPVHSSASAGTNQLLYDGPGPVRDADDVLVALGSAVPARPRPAAARRAGTHSIGGGNDEARPSGSPPAPPETRPAGPGLPAAPTVTPPAGRLLDEIGWQPRSLNWIAARTGTPVALLAGSLEELVAAGLLTEERGWWQRRPPDEAAQRATR